MSNHKVDSDVINVITKGIVNVIGDVKYTQTPIDKGGGSYQITATVRVNIDSDDIDKWFAKDEQERETLIEQNKELQRSNAEKDKEIEQLKRQIANVKSEADQDRLTAQFETADKEFLSTQKREEANKYLYDGNYELAEETYNEARMLMLGDLDIYWSANRNIDEINEHMLLHPSELDYSERGLIYYSSKQYAHAVDDFSKAIELNPKSAESYNGRANAYYHLKNYEQALNDYSMAINLDIHCGIYHINRGNLYLTIKNFNKAIDDFFSAIVLRYFYVGVDYAGKELWRAYQGRGIAYYHLKKYSNAIADFNKAIELNPNSASSYYNRGLCYKSRRKNAKAEADFAKARELGYNG